MNDITEREIKYQKKCNLIKTIRGLEYLFEGWREMELRPRQNTIISFTNLFWILFGSALNFMTESEAVNIFKPAVASLKLFCETYRLPLSTVRFPGSQKAMQDLGLIE